MSIARKPKPKLDLDKLFDLAYAIKRERWKQQRSTERRLLKKISATPALVSLLYDLNLMPEQTRNNPGARYKMLLIAAHWPENPTPKP